jgi:Tfp pilus assembly protein PilV
MTSPRRAHRPGFSLVEALAAILIGSVVLTALYLLMQGVNETRRNARRTADLIVNGLQANTAMREDLEAASTGATSTWNWAPVTASSRVTADGQDDDTLTTFRVLQPPGHVSTQGCRTPASNCVRIVGDATDVLMVGGVVVVGSPGTGAIVAQIVSVSTPFDAACGADCAGAETVTCPDSAWAPLVVSVVTGSVLTPPTGPPTTQAIPCAASVLSDGTRCDETSAPATAGNRTIGRCRVPSAGTGRYTEITVVDRTTTPFHLPQPPVRARQSGALGTPAVSVQIVEPLRYWIDASAPSHPRLVKQTGLSPAGTWTTALPVAVDITGLRVEVQHVGDSTWTRGTGVTDEILSVASGNANLLRATAPGAGAPRGIAFLRSYRSIAAVRVRYIALSHGGPTPASAARQWIPLAAIVATPGFLGDGNTPP